MNDIDNEITLVHNSIIDLFIDSKGDLWIGTRGGISYKNQEKQAIYSQNSFAYTKRRD